MPTARELVEEALRPDPALPPTQRTAARVQALEAAVRALAGLAPPTLEVRLLHPRAVAPARTRAGDAGYDLRAVEGVSVPRDAHRVVPTGVAIALPPGYAGLVTPRSGLAAEHGITLVNTPGLIDPNYRGEIKAILRNEGERPFAVEPGDRIAQLLLVPFWAPALEVVAELPGSDRGADGFGSSGRR